MKQKYDSMSKKDCWDAVCETWDKYKAVDHHYLTREKMLEIDCLIAELEDYVRRGEPK